jgi:hypothetical protein
MDKLEKIFDEMEAKVCESGHLMVSSHKFCPECGKPPRPPLVGDEAARALYKLACESRKKSTPKTSFWAWLYKPVRRLP